MVDSDGVATTRVPAGLHAEEVASMDAHAGSRIAALAASAGVNLCRYPIVTRWTGEISTAVLAISIVGACLTVGWLLITHAPAAVLAVVLLTGAGAVRSLRVAFLWGEVTRSSLEPEVVSVRTRLGLLARERRVARLHIAAVQLVPGNCAGGRRGFELELRLNDGASLTVARFDDEEEASLEQARYRRWLAGNSPVTSGAPFVQQQAWTRSDSAAPSIHPFPPGPLAHVAEHSPARCAGPRLGLRSVHLAPWEGR
jgi:hypothetical protein